MNGSVAGRIPGKWSPRAGEIVSRLIAGRPPDKRGLVGPHASRLAALPIGGSMWADYYLRPSGEVVVVGEDWDYPDVDTVHTDWSNVLRMLVWGAERYPELRELLPVRGPEAIDCPTCQSISIFGEGKVLCPTCGGLHWLLPATPEQ